MARSSIASSPFHWGCFSSSYRLSFPATTCTRRCSSAFRPLSSQCGSCVRYPNHSLPLSISRIVIACINAFLAAALASTGHFCFAAVASGSVVLILPGYIVLCGSLELANRSIISGSVRLVYSILYSLFLGFGLAMGSEVYQRVTGLAISGATDYTCSALRTNAPWWRATIPPWFCTSPVGFCLPSRSS